MFSAIYYTRTGSGEFGKSGMDRTLAVGVLERTSTGWIALDEPLLTGTTERPEVLEPKAGYWDDRWRIWYMTTPKRYTGPWNAVTRNPVLVVGTRFDPNTSYANARATAKRLGNALLQDS